jgi:hypothetical protein
MRKTAVALVAIGVIAAACGAETSSGETVGTTPTTSRAVTTTDAPTTTRAEGVVTTTTTPVVTTPPVVVDGPPAPDFTLALEDPAGETFTLSEEQKPVYMVFWAEW